MYEIFLVNFWVMISVSGLRTINLKDLKTFSKKLGFSSPETQTHRHAPLKTIRAWPIHELRESRGHSVRVYRMRQSSAD